MTKSEKERLSKNLKAALNISGISAMDLSRKLDVHYDTIMKWLAGKNTGYLKRLEEICEILGVDLSEIYEPKGPTNRRIGKMEKDQEIAYLKGRIDQLESIILGLVNSGNLNFPRGTKNTGAE